jgi:aminoglycoside 6'-N-acetyltransferase
MHRWLNTQHVTRWYGDAPSFEEVREKYEPRISGQVPVEPYLILHGELPIGYIQWYRLSDYSAYAESVRVEEDAAGVDLFIGEAEYLHRGLGSHVLRRFLARVVFADGRVGSCVIGPSVENEAAIRACAKAGFRHFGTVQVPGEPAPEYLMRVSREELLQG